MSFLGYQFLSKVPPYTHYLVLTSILSTLSILMNEPKVALFVVPALITTLIKSFDTNVEILKVGSNWHYQYHKLNLESLNTHYHRKNLYHLQDHVILDLIKHIESRSNKAFSELNKLGLLESKQIGGELYIKSPPPIPWKQVEGSLEWEEHQPYLLPSGKNPKEPELVKAEQEVEEIVKNYDKQLNELSASSFKTRHKKKAPVRGH